MMKKTDKPSTLNRSDRPTRLPITGFRNKLTVEGQEAGFHYCWVRDDLIARFERAEYSFVTHDVIVGDVHIASSAIGGKVSVPGGNGVTLFLMRVPQELYDGDMQELADDIDEKELDMYRQLNSSKDGQYGKVEIDVKSRRK
jgi:hypothetical protein